jgi:hypothetical protein
MPTADRYRRAPGLVIFWDASQAVCFVWRSAQRFPITFEAAALLDQLSGWTTVEQLADRIGAGDARTTVAETIALLLELALVEREETASAGDWQQWSPEATFFHFATKNGVFPEDLGARDRALAEKATHHPQPAPTKRVAGQRHRLPEIAMTERDLDHALTRRRTWRRFSDRPVPAGALGTLLSRTFAVQQRGRVEGQGPVIQRTSPSGGSRHPIEAYVLAWNVDGLAPGAYHYDSSRASRPPGPRLRRRVERRRADRHAEGQGARRRRFCQLTQRPRKVAPGDGWLHGHPRAGAVRRTRYRPRR